jgi:cytochrome P450
MVASRKPETEADPLSHRAAAEPTRANLNADTLTSDPLSFLTRLGRDGDLAEYTTAYGPVSLLIRPDYIRQFFHSGKYGRGSTLKLVLGDGLLAAEGPTWRRQRRVMQPVFRHDKVAAFGPAITATTTGLFERWQRPARSNEPVDVAAEMARLTLKIIGRTLFTVEWEERLAVLAEAVATLIDDVGRLMGTLFAMTNKIEPARNRRIANALRVLDQEVLRVIEERRRSEKPFDDLLAALLAYRDGETGAGLDDRQMRDEFVTMLLAGHVTTGNMLAWTWYLMSQHPKVEQRLQEELYRTLGGRLPTVQDLPKLQYTRMVLQESLRIYPPVWFIARKALEADRFGPHRIAPGATVVVSPYVIHRHPRYWPAPEQFKPERFSPLSPPDREPPIYFPFGEGQHVCIGTHFALLEGALVLATITQRYRLRPIPHRPVEPDPSLTLQIRGGLPMTIEERPASELS